MLRNDPIVSKYPEYLPTEDEVALTAELLRREENEPLRRALEAHVRIGGDAEASLWRFCWQARQDGERGDACATGALRWLARCVENRARLGMDKLLNRTDLFSTAFGDNYVAAFPFSFHGVTKGGHPVYVARYGSVNVKALERVWQEGEALQRSFGLAVNGAVLYYLRAMEYMTQVVMGRESERQGRVVDRMMAILDFEGVGMHLWNSCVKAFLSGVSSESSALFPETLHCMVVTNVPWLISNALWPIARNFMHPVTQAKICFARGSDVPKVLLQHVSAELLPPYLGGACTCKECESGALRGGSMRLWEEDILARPAPLPSVEDPVEAGAALVPTA
eukprot:TRINITY_DN25557_c0_g1_i1.p1 TRINITY_DN25557_c0_g1~~TRINITY_DN25557_c0_g1_i1.p1  ORF type:complete len:336 (-),score=52.96 TRINITY_DN25557_c0_g1_i1:43-1050(-)